MKKKVAIIGVGFMGGSLALALREKFPDFVIWGYARSNESYRRIKKLNGVHKIEKNLKSLVGGADFVVLALPLSVIIEYLEKIAPFLKKDAIVFDLGSSKELIEKAAKKYLPKKAYFVGCHPLCGGEKGGVEYSCSSLYNGELCLITSSPNTNAAKIIKSLWEKVGSKVVFLRPRRHDKILSAVSHLPHLISFSLTYFIAENYLRFSSRSLKDLTRISNSPPSVWADIFFFNKENLLKDLNGFIKVLKSFSAVLKEGDRKKIISLIEEVNKKHQIIIKDS